MPKSPAVANLILSSDGNFAVATTGEDKSVHVFSIDDEGHIQHVNQRQMIKRPCAVAFTPDNDSILVGDKFGDVYALPLHYEAPVTPNATESNGTPPKSTPFKPTASNLTVHSGRNLKALESQKRQAESTSIQAKERDIMTFEHELLLGHVSMLTGLITARKTNGPSHRNYIITADRDEHVRVSRGRPQAYVIENYCFGHTQFVSRLCMASEDVLVSGGGDDFLLVWDWTTGVILTKLDLREAWVHHLNQQGAASSLSEPLTVCGLWASHSSDSLVTIYCACEGLAVIIEYQLKLRDPCESYTRPSKVTACPHNILDAVVVKGQVGDEGADSDRLLLSLDTLHLPNSKEASSEAACSRLQYLSNEPTAPDGDDGPIVEDAASTLELLYSLEKLRKRGNEDD